MEHLPEFIANHLFLVSLLAGILMLLFWNLFGDSMSGVAQLSPMQATRMLNHEHALLLDVRPEPEYRAGHILNAMNLPAGNLPERQDELKQYRDRPVILFCKNGMDSMRIARMLKAGGFEKLFCLKGGLQTWSTAGLPLTRETVSGETA